MVVNTKTGEMRPVELGNLFYNQVYAKNKSIPYVSIIKISFNRNSILPAIEDQFICFVTSFIRPVENNKLGDQWRISRSEAS